MNNSTSDHRTNPAERLPVESLSVSEEIIEIDGVLNFYIDTDFDVEAVFGTHVEASEGSDWMNLYANVEIATGQICDALVVSLRHDEKQEEELRYPLSDLEKEVLQEKLEQYCLKDTGLSLTDYCAQLRQEAETAPSYLVGPQM